MTTQPAVSEFDVVLKRTYDAPVDMLWRAWTDPQEMKQWWGPKSFTNPVCELDVRVGGAWKIVMRSPDGTDYPITGVYREVVPNKRLVMTDSVAEHNQDWHDLVNASRPEGSGQSPTEYLITVTFEENNGRTTVSVRTHFNSAADRDALVKIGMSEGWNESFDKLTDVLKAN
jgi:uncharacterized protein YndB with AHSA1/START domain